MEGNYKPKIGDQLHALLKFKIDENTWELKCAKIPAGWEVILKSQYEESYEINEEKYFWISKIFISEKSIILSDSKIGRNPITDGMRPKYILALQETLKIIGNPDVDLAINADNLSEMKGMFNRCVRQDQKDWFTVYKMLSRPSEELMEKSADVLSNLARSVKQSRKDDIAKWLSDLRSLNLEAILKNCLAHVSNDVTHLDKAVIFNSVSNNEKLAKSSDEEFILSQVSKEKMERASSSHKYTLQNLVSFLESNGFIVENNQLVDAYCRLKTGPAIFEVKSITTENERSQCRAALSQLYEYKYLQSLPEASLWIIFSRQPALEWLIDYLYHDRNIEVLWLNNDKLEGPSLSYLLESRS